MESRWLGGEIWGYHEGNELISICHAAANLAPVLGTPESLDAFAARALAQGRTCGSIMGPEDEVRHLWRILGPEWGPARSIRPQQPFMVLDGAPAVQPSPDVRRVRPDELDILYPACVAMYTEELGVSPEANGGARLYRARVAQLIAKGHAFAHIDGDAVVFKAELGAVTPTRPISSPLGRPAPPRRGPGRGRRRRGLRADLARRGTGGVAVREPAQRARPPDLSAGRLHHHRHLRHDPVLTLTFGGRACPGGRPVETP